MVRMWCLVEIENETFLLGSTSGYLDDLDCSALPRQEISAIWPLSRQGRQKPKCEGYLGLLRRVVREAKFRKRTQTRQFVTQQDAQRIWAAFLSRGKSAPDAAARSFATPDGYLVYLAEAAGRERSHPNSPATCGHGECGDVPSCGEFAKRLWGGGPRHFPLGSACGSAKYCQGQGA